MISEFEIAYSQKRRAEPCGFSREYYLDAPPVQVGLAYFTSAYDGVFTLHFDNLSLDFDFDPDLNVLFFFIPVALEKLLTRNEEPQDIYFCQHGTEVKLFLQAAGEAVALSFEKGNSRFPPIPHDTPIFVSLVAFVAEWVQFTGAVLEAIKTLKPELEGDQSYQEYKMRLLGIESTLRQEVGQREESVLVFGE
jgi:hypothetical protein